MKPSINELIRSCFLVGVACGHEYERLPWALCQRLVWYGLDDDPQDPNDRPGDGLGVLALLVGRAKHGVEGGYAHLLGADPAGDDWRGVSKRSGGHWNSGTRSAPFGGLYPPHLDSGALGDLYERFGTPDHRGPWFDVEGDPVVFNAIARGGGLRWLAWLDWATELYEYDEQVALQGGQPPCATWCVHYWLSKFWAPAWDAAEWEDDDGLLWEAASASAYARFANSASGAAKRHAGKAAHAIAAAYRAYKLESRGERAAERAERSIAYAARVPEILAAAMIGAL